MIEYIKQHLNGDNPTTYIYQLAVLRSQIETLQREFEKEYSWCSCCQEYVKQSKFTENVEDGRVVVRCQKCNGILKFQDMDW